MGIINIENSNFINCSAERGGGIYSNEGTIYLLDSTFTNCTAKDGGAIFLVDGANSEIVNGSFVDCSATRYGGAIGFTFEGNVINSSFDSCNAPYGGAVFNSSVEGSSFVNCVANEGGAVYNGSVISSLFTNCTALRGPDVYGGSKTNCKVIDCEKTNVDIVFSQSGTYYNDKNLTINVTAPYNGIALANVSVLIKFSNGKNTTLTTNNKGIAIYKIPFNPATYNLTAKVVGNDLVSEDKVYSNIKIVKIPATISVSAVSTTYDSCKYMLIKVVNSGTKSVVANANLTIKIYTGKKVATATIKTNKSGIAKYDASRYGIGTHKVVISSTNPSCLSATTKTSSYKIAKGTLMITAPKVTNKYKKAGSFKITVTNKVSKKVVKSVKLVVKVYTGKKYKTFNLKTNSKGIATISTKTLNKGSHKVIISIKATTPYKAVSKSGQIVIK